MTDTDLVQHKAAFVPGESVVAFGSIRKIVPGEIEIPFGTTFQKPPMVFLTPYWPNGGVGFIETVVSINTESCTITSKNAAQNYHVNWLAIGI